jgi:hypothetical protein
MAALIAIAAFPGVPGWSQTVGTQAIVTAQTGAAQNGIPSSNSSEASLTLPDEPGLLRASSSLDAAPLSAESTDGQSTSGSAKNATATGATLPEASRTQRVIQPGQAAPALNVGGKALFGLRDAFSLFAGVGWLASAGWDQAINGSPNYGTDRGAFGERLGAAAIRDTSETLVGDCVLAPLLHEDPRYYRMGPSHNFFVRLVYAGTRPIITRTDGGRLSPNFAELGGDLAGSALTNTYYPPLNHGVTQTMETLGGSVGGSAVGDVVSEFLTDFVGLFHSGHK